MNPAYDAQSWQGFYIMTGGAAAALAGLLFVAMSLHATTITQHPFFMSRAVGTLMSLTSMLLIAASVLVPAQPRRWIGIEVEAVAIFFLAVTIRGMIMLGTRWLSRSRLRAVAETIGGGLWHILFVVAGISLIFGAGGGFYWLAVVMVFMFGWNIYTAWMLITEVSEDSEGG